MNKDQADIIIERWRKATKELEAVLKESTIREVLKEFNYRWAVKGGTAIIVEYWNDNKIYVCGSPTAYEKSTFDSLGEFI